MPSLYEITQDLMQVIHEMESAGLDQETIQDTLEANRDEFEAKASAIVGHIKNMRADAEAFKAESKRLAEEAKKIEKKQAFWTHYLDVNMKALDIKQLKDGVHELKYRKGTEVVEINEEQLPKQYFVPQEPKPMGKTDLKKLVKEGQTIPGVSLVRNPDSLQIK